MSARRRLAGSATEKRPAGMGLGAGPASDENRRLFKALGDRFYLGPNVKPADTAPADAPGIPVYLSYDGKFYDRHYREVVPDAAHGRFEGVPAGFSLDDPVASGSGTARRRLSNRLLIGRSSTGKLQPTSSAEAHETGDLDPRAAVFTSFPSEDAFDNFFDYEQALLDWKVETERVLRHIQLPRVVGRYYSRPKVLSSDGDDDAASTAPAPSTPTPTTPVPPAATPPPASGTPSATFARSTEPWDAQLIPVEPEPAWYATFDEYEAALMRWAHICGKVPVIPPHALQFTELIGLTPSKAPDNTKKAAPKLVDSNKSQKDGSVRQRRLTSNTWQRLETISLVGNPAPRGSSRAQGGRALAKTSSGRSILRKVILESHDEWDNLSPTAHDHLRTMVDSLLKRIQENEARYKIGNAPILPLIHGTFIKPVSDLDMPLIPRGTRQPLRRTDLSGPERASCYDCPGEIRGNVVDFKAPVYDVDYVELGKLASGDQEYRSDLRQAVQEIQFAPRFDKHSAWYNPKDTEAQTEVRSDVISAIMSAYMGNNRPLTVDQLQEIFALPLYLDSYRALLDEHRPEQASDDGPVTFSQEMLRCVVKEDGVDVDSLEVVVLFFDNLEDELIRAKTALYIHDFLQSRWAKDGLQKLISRDRLRLLQHIATAASFFAPVPVDIFPFMPDSLAIAQMHFPNGKMDALLRDVFVFYYLDIVRESFASGAASFLFAPINQYIAELQKRQSAAMVDAIAADPQFMANIVTKGVGSRSSTVSALFLFVLIQLLNNPDQALRDLLVKPETGLLAAIRTLGASKMSHVHFALRRIFAVMQRGSPWKAYLLTSFLETTGTLYESEGLPIIVDDLSTLAYSKQTTRPILASLILDLFRDELPLLAAENGTGKQIVPTIVALFPHLIRIIAADKEPAGPVCLAISELLAILARECHRMGLFRAAAVDTFKSKAVAMERKSDQLQIQYQDVRKLFGIVQAINAPGTFPMRTNLLTTLRHMLKVKGIFHFLKKEVDFFQRLVDFCRDGKSVEFNRNAWRLFFQIIRYHSNGLELLQKNGQLVPILEIIGPISGKVIMLNGLHYLAKLFRLVEIEQQRRESGRPPVREELKTVEKDVKALVDLFIKRHLFIKIHMIYKNFIEKTPGRPFQKLANVYYVIATSSHTTKLYKDIYRNPEYKQGLVRMNQMHNIEPGEPSVSATLRDTIGTAGRKNLSRIFQQSRSSGGNSNTE